MRKYSKVAALIVCILSSAHFALQAQTYRVEAGYAQPRIYSSEISHRFFHEFRLGGTAEFDFPQVGFLSFQTGLSYSYLFGNNSQRGRYPNVLDSLRINTQGHQLNIPVYAIASYTIVRVIRVSAFAGPNFNIGLAMPQRVETNIVVDDTPTGMRNLRQIEGFGYRLGNSDLYDGRLRRFNLQMDVGASAQWWKIQVRGGYSFGLNNISNWDIRFYDPISEDNIFTVHPQRQRQSGWFVSLAYEF